MATKKMAKKKSSSAKKRSTATKRVSAKKATGAKARIQTIPYGLFWTLLKVNAIFDRDPAFTVGQLKALVTPDVFEVIDWPTIFGVRATPLQEALNKTFRDPVYSHITLDF